MSFFKNLLVAGALLALPAVASAQVIEQASAEARARMACGSGTLISAKYIGGGMLQVTCSQPTQQAQTQAASGGAALAGTGLTAPVAGGIVVSVLLLGALTGSDSDSTTTSTTSSTGYNDFVGER